MLGKLKVNLTRNDAVERVTRIELAWPAWKAGALPLSYTRVTVMIFRRQRRRLNHGVGATGLEPAIFCSQSRRASRYATPRPSGMPERSPMSVGHSALRTNRSWMAPTYEVWPP